MEYWVEQQYSITPMWAKTNAALLSAHAYEKVRQL